MPPLCPCLERTRGANRVQVLATNSTITSLAKLLATSLLISHRKCFSERYGAKKSKQKTKMVAR